MKYAVDVLIIHLKNVCGMRVRACVRKEVAYVEKK